MPLRPYVVWHLARLHVTVVLEAIELLHAPTANPRSLKRNVCKLLGFPDDVSARLTLKSLRKCLEERREVGPWVSCRGAVVRGDQVRFVEPVIRGWEGHHAASGHRTVIADVLGDNFGKLCRRHTYTLRVIRSEGDEPLRSGQTILRRIQDFSRAGHIRRRPWDDEDARLDAIAEQITRKGARRACKTCP